MDFQYNIENQTSTPCKILVPTPHASPLGTGVSTMNGQRIGEALHPGLKWHASQQNRHLRVHQRPKPSNGMLANKIDIFEYIMAHQLLSEPDLPGPVHGQGPHVPVIFHPSASKLNGPKNFGLLGAF